ncbi:MAG TPA: hypothetical protein VJT31_02550, partial [Rugosimonospora sp.]|nr:hypothetical protein [Rugosimonospora sp.]
AAATDRATMQTHHERATAWHRGVEVERARDPGTAAAPRFPGEFRPEALRPDLRTRYDALTDPRARDAYADLYRRLGGDEHRLTDALDRLEHEAYARRTTLEHLLAEHASPIRDLAARVEPIDRSTVDSFARRHPEVRGVDRWQRALDRGDARPVEDALALAERSDGVVEVDRSVSAKTPDGAIVKGDVDVVAAGGRIWRESKTYDGWGIAGREFAEARAQAERQLKILAFGAEYHVDGQVPRLEWHFPRGIDGGVARALEDVRITDPRTGRELPYRVAVTGDRLDSAGGRHSAAVDVSHSAPGGGEAPEPVHRDAVSPAEYIDPRPPKNLPHPWPVDPVNEYVIQQRDLEFIGVTREQVELWMAREAPLGMTPELYREWRISLLEALRRDGVPLDTVDIRLRGSTADFFSGVHKKLPTETELADNPESAAGLRRWLGDDPNRPTSRPFDSMHLLGLDEPSDYDINISSGAMFERAKAHWDPAEFKGPLSKDHGYLNKELVKQEFPHLLSWSEEWFARTGRDMSYAIFGGDGPTDMSHLGFYVHFRESDWIVHRPGTEHAADLPEPGAGSGPPKPAGAVGRESTAERTWSADFSSGIVSADGTVTQSETAKTASIQAVTDHMTAPLGRLIAAGAAEHVDPALAERLGDGNFVIVLRDPRYPSMGGSLLHRADVDPAQLARTTDRTVPLDSPGAERLVREMAVSELIMAWAHDANGLSVRSLAIQEAATVEFGLRDVLGWRMTDETRAQVATEYAAHGAVHREILRVQYDLTQRELARRGVNNLILYRAYSWPAGEHPDWAAHPEGAIIEMPPQRPISSWTGVRQIAADWLATRPHSGVILAARFPREALLAFPRTGIGCLWQVEFVALARQGWATVDVVHEATAQ